MHEDQLPIDASVVTALVAAQFPQWCGLAVRAVPPAGTVNALFRIGDGLVARFPLRPDDPAAVRVALEREMSAAAELSGRVPVLTPEPVALGRPGPGYPLPWVVQTWLPGEPAWDRPLSPECAAGLGALVRALRSIEVGGRRFSGPGRGGELTAHDAWVAHCLERSDGLFDVAAVAALWTRLRGLPRRSPDVMAHTDLTPGNVLLDGAGRLAGLLDVGGFGPADPALDLMVAWTMLEPGPRERFRSAVDADDLDWQRSRGWALEQAVGLVWYYRLTNPAMHRLGLRTIGRLLHATASDSVGAGCQA